MFLLLLVFYPLEPALDLAHIDDHLLVDGHFVEVGEDVAFLAVDPDAVGAGAIGDGHMVLGDFEFGVEGRDGSLVDDYPCLLLVPPYGILPQEEGQLGYFLCQILRLQDYDITRYHFLFSHLTIITAKSTHYQLPFI